jgi:uncharacterized cupredoxin-like copper-binding protein
MAYRSTRVASLASGALAILLASCGTDTPAVTGSTPTGSTVAVTLQEFAVIPAPATAAAGSVTFEATNNGPDDDHELVVIKTDLATDALPTKPDGAVDEEGAAIEAIGEIEEFPPGETKTTSFDLTAGAYVLICNVVEVDNGETEAHYQKGMRAAFNVT